MQEKKLDSKIIYHGKILELNLDTVQLSNGKQAKREVVIHPGAVAIIAFNADNKILLIRQFRYPVGEILWEIPAGKLDKGEDPEQCAKRELIEETGYRAEEWQYLATFFTTPGFSNEVMYLYLAKDLYDDKASPDDDEFIEVVPTSIDDALEKINLGEIKDAKTLLGILMAEKILRSS